MPLFGKTKVAGSREDAIAGFWDWWREARASFEDAIEARQLPPSLIEEISRRVKAIDAALVWEVGPGPRTGYQLCVSADGDIERRALTELWLKSASPDTGWTYYAAKQPTPAATSLQIGPHRVEAAGLRCRAEVDAGRERVDLQVWHPLFPSLDERTRAQVAYLLLDALLGEDDVERWLGSVDLVADKPADAKDPDALLLTIQELARSATGERFVLGQAAGPDGLVRIVAVNTSLKHIDHLDKPFRLRLVIRLKTRGANGLPARDEVDALDALEHRIENALEHAAFAGRVTGAGKRTLNWYVADPGAAEAAASKVARASGWESNTRSEADPRWDGIKRNLLD